MVHSLEYNFGGLHTQVLAGYIIPWMINSSFSMVEDIVTNGIFIDKNKNVVVEDIVEWLKTWWCEKIHEKVNGLDILSTVHSWTDIMNKVDLKTICKNNNQYTLTDVNAFDQALIYYITNA